MEFYQSVFGGELNLMTFADIPGVPTAPDEGHKVMHGQLNGDNGIVLMGADTPSGMDHQPFNGSISLSGDDEAALRGYWDRLVAGGTVGEPLEKAPGATRSACASTSSASAGWSTSPAVRSRFRTSSIPARMPPDPN